MVVTAMIEKIKNTEIPVTNIQKFSTHDGPGIRTTVFLKGCPLDCVWCHNPETKKRAQQLLYTAQKCITCGKCVPACPNGAHIISEAGAHELNFEFCDICLNCVKICPAGVLEPACVMMTPEQIMREVLQDIVFYGEKGGITLSGGEPLAHPEQALELLGLAKQNNISAAVETSGYFDEIFIPKFVEATDLFIWDCKDTNPLRHFKYTGVYPDKILRNLFLTDSLVTQDNIILRCIMVKGVNMAHEHYDGIAEIFSRLKHCPGVELIPCHALGDVKNRQLGAKETYNNDWSPSRDEIESIKNILRKKGVTILN